jgi:methylglutaconyl-CoA hydratase
MTLETIHIATDPRGIATLTLARPEKHNAINAQMMVEITDACSAINTDITIRAVILRAQGKSFCAGGDLDWMREQFAADRAGKITQATVLSNMLNALDTLNKPLIGIVDGNAFGGGLGMMAVCDIVIAKPNLKFAFTETKLGLIPATIGPFVLRRMGETYARQVFITAKTFDSDFAQTCGLVSVITNDTDAALGTEINAILATQPNAASMAKALLQTLRATDTKTEITTSINALADCWQGDEAQQQISAFLKGKS